MSNDQIFLCVNPYCKVENLFDSPICSTAIGIYKVSELSSDIVKIKLSSLVKKCILLPYKRKFVALELLHSKL